MKHFSISYVFKTLCDYVLMSGWYGMVVGIKTREWKSVKIGSLIIFYNDLKVTVKNITYHRDFEGVYNVYGEKFTPTTINSDYESLHLRSILR